jgi:hypothetical protein
MNTKYITYFFIIIVYSLHTSSSSHAIPLEFLCWFGSIFSTPIGSKNHWISQSESICDSALYFAVNCVLGVGHLQKNFSHDEEF